MSDSTGIPADWYPDPGDASQLRYWDGAGWTGHVVPRPAAAPTPVATPDPAPAVVQAPSSGVQTASTYTPAPQTDSYMPLSQVVDPVPTFEMNFDEGKPNTVGGWLYAFVPVLILLQLYLPVSARPEDLATQLGPLAARAALGLAALVVAIALAAVDRRQLRDRGFEFLPPAILGLLLPVYVIVRLMRVGMRGLAITLVALLVQAGVGYALYLQLPGLITAPPAVPTDEPAPEGMVPPYTADQLAYLLTSEGMAAKILYDAHNTALHYETVDCVPLASTDLGAQTTCEGKSSLADYLIRVQVLANSDGTPFTVVSVTPSLHA